LRPPTRRLATAVVFLGAAPALLVGCGSKTVQGSEVSRRISDGLARQVGQRPAQIKCPKQIEAKAGQKARCTIVGADGSEIGLTVTMKDDQGKFDFAVDNKLSKPPTKR
jgi:hypothetical protein